MSVQFLKVSEDDDGQRLDRWIKKQRKAVAITLIQKLIRKGAVRIDGKRAKNDTKLSPGQEVKIPAAIEEASKQNKNREKIFKPNEQDKAFIKSLILYQDEHVIAINKPHGLATQGGSKVTRHVDGLLEVLKDKKGVKPRLVHRLDKDTSGVLLLARSAKIAKKLGEVFKGRDAKKIYWALVSPAPEQQDGSIKAPLIKAGGVQKEKMIVDQDEGKFAITDFMVLERAMDDAAFIAFWPRTGRTHQIRVHAQLMGSSIVGDGKYKAPVDPERKKPLPDFAELNLAKRLHLHAQRLILPHPGRSGVLDITALLPAELTKSWKALGFDPKYKGNPFED